jgi:hypothetical protein
MYRQSIPIGNAEPSFFYLIMAAACFRRAAGISHPNTRCASRDIGRVYLSQGQSLCPETQVRGNQGSVLCQLRKEQMP